MARLVIVAVYLLCGLWSVSSNAGVFAGTTWTTKSGWDYSPSHMVDQWDGGKEKMWWCGNPGNNVDAIMYSAIVGGAWTTPQVVLQMPSQGHTCDPTVIRGSWHYAPSNITGHYIMYFDTANTEGIWVALSEDGIHWTAIGTVFHTQFSGKGAYASMPVAMSTNAGSGVRIVYMDLDGASPRYFVRTSADGFNFTGPSELSSSLSPSSTVFTSFRSPAIGFAVSNTYYWMARVSQTDSNNDPVAISIYRIPTDSLLTGSWTKSGELSANAVKYYQFEPGFKTDSYGNIQNWLPYASMAFGCASKTVGDWYTVSTGAGDVNHSDICGAVGLVQ